MTITVIINLKYLSKIFKIIKIIMINIIFHL